MICNNVVNRVLTLTLTHSVLYFHMRYLEKSSSEKTKINSEANSKRHHKYQVTVGESAARTMREVQELQPLGSPLLDFPTGEIQIQMGQIQIWLSDYSVCFGIRIRDRIPVAWAGRGSLKK